MIEIIAAKKCGRKTCDRAGQVLPIADFNGNGDSKDGYRYECRDCQRKYNSAYVKKSRKSARKAFVPDTGDWPLAAPPPLDVQLAHLHMKRAYGAMPGQLRGAL